MKRNNRKSAAPDPEVILQHKDRVIRHKRRDWEIEKATLETLCNDPNATAEDLEAELDILRRILQELVPIFNGYLEMLSNEGHEERYTDNHGALEKIKNESTRLDVRVSRKIEKLQVSHAPDDDVLSIKSRDFYGGRKLPKLELPKFTGEVRDWLPFWSQFQEIHDDDSIPSIDKFQYLIQSTLDRSEAREIVRSYPLCSDNYKLAVDHLKKKYGREKMLVKVYVRDLLKLVIENAQHKTNGLSGLFVKLASKIRALGTLGVTTDKCAAIIYPLVESCLPSEVLRAWQRDPTFKEAQEKNTDKELEKLMEFLEKEVGAEDNIRLACTELIQKDTSSQQKMQIPKNKSKENVPTASGLLATETELDKKKNSCIFCEKPHNNEDCGKVRDISLEERKSIVAKSGVCFTCLRKGHQSKKCKAFVKCFLCGGRHRTIMCQGKAVPKEKVSSEGKESKEESKPSTTNMSNGIQTPEVLLQTLVVNIHATSSVIKARALIDTGSHKSYILESLAKKIGLERVGEERVIHQLFGGIKTEEKHHNRYQLKLSDLNERSTYTMIASDISKISGKISCIPHGPWIQELAFKGIDLSDIEENTEVEILIGQDVASYLFTGNRIELDSGPVAMETILGWTLSGQITKRNFQCSMLVNNLHVQDVDLSKLWNLDVIGITDSVDRKSKEEMEQAAMDHFNSTVKKEEDGRFQVDLPWIEGHPPLPSNKLVATRRLENATKILKSNGKLEAYDAVFKSWEELGIIEEVPECEVNNPSHYIPHRAVYKENSATTPIRPVFDASCKVKGNPSLNDCVERGPNLLELIPAVVTRFRIGPVGVTADIKKAFQQISLSRKDRDFVRFLWWKDLSCTKLKEYRHCRVVFGVSCSPFLLGATLNKVLYSAYDHPAPVSMKNTIEILENSLYVDNVAASLESTEEAKEFQQQANNLLLSAQFELRGWEFAPSEENREVALLGLNWNLKEDTLSVDTTAIMKNMDGSPTKRKLLSLAHMVFDPIGFTAPFTIIPKLMLQDLWSLKISWDSALPEEEEKSFRKWVRQVQNLNEIKIPRWMNSLQVAEQKSSLHVFVDASKRAYAACVFIRIVRLDQIYVHLVQAKSRVAPIKPVTIPRLELLSCLIGARLALSVKEMLKDEQIPVTFWSDSSTALYWIKSVGNWGVFVQNRVMEIRKITKPEDWRHIPGEENPADLPSRGCNFETLKKSKWWEGPSFLKKEENFWPVSSVIFDAAEIELERKRTVTSAANIQHEGLKKLMDKEKFEDMIKTVIQESSLENSENAWEEAEFTLLKLVQQQTQTVHVHVLSSHPQWELQVGPCIKSC